MLRPELGISARLLRPWCDGRLADYQARAEAEFAAFGAGIAHHRPQRFESDLADLSARHGERGERGLGEFGDQDVVEADHRKIFGTRRPPS